MNEREKAVNQHFTTGQITKLTGVSVKTLHGWVSAGLLGPPAPRMRGSGSDRTYDFSDLVTVQLISSARRLGFPLLTLRSVAATVRSAVRAGKPNGQVLVLCNGKISLAKSPELAAALRTRSTPVMALLNLDHVYEISSSLAADAPSIRRGRPPKS